MTYQVELKWNQTFKMGLYLSHPQVEPPSAPTKEETLSEELIALIAEVMVDMFDIDMIPNELEKKLYEVMLNHLRKSLLND